MIQLLRIGNLFGVDGYDTILIGLPCPHRKPPNQCQQKRKPGTRSVRGEGINFGL